MSSTKGIVSFSAKNTVVLIIASLCALAGFLWPFFYKGSELPPPAVT